MRFYQASMASLFYREPLPVRPQPSAQPLINFFFLGLFAISIVFQAITYSELMELRNTVRDLQSHASR
jgi:hypothetical protein